MVVSNRNLLFQGSIFRGYVSFRQGTLRKTSMSPEHQWLVQMYFRKLNSPFLEDMLCFGGVCEDHQVMIPNNDPNKTTMKCTSLLLYGKRSAFRSTRVLTLELTVSLLFNHIIITPTTTIISTTITWPLLISPPPFQLPTISLTHFGGTVSCHPRYVVRRAWSHRNTQRLQHCKSHRKSWLRCGADPNQGYPFETTSVMEKKGPLVAWVI